MHDVQHEIVQIETKIRFYNDQLDELADAELPRLALCSPFIASPIYIVANAINSEYYKLRLAR